MLLTPVENLNKTDIAEHAVAALSHSKITKVSIVGRRGPLQAPATIKELRELMNVTGVSFQAPEEGWTVHTGIQEQTLPRQLKRIMDLLGKGSKMTTGDHQKFWQMLYLLRPQAFCEGASPRWLGKVDFEQMQYKVPMEEALETIDEETKNMAVWERPPAILNRLRNLPVVGTGQSIQLPASAVFRSIGYLSEPLDKMEKLGIQFDVKRGIIPNDIHGRVLASDQGPDNLTAAHLPGMYCAGWVKRGPTGVIASTLDDAFRTADVLVSDWQNGVPFNQRVVDADKLGLEGVRSTLEERNIRAISWTDWERIAAEEVRRGSLKNKPREKIVDVNEMLSIV